MKPNFEQMNGSNGDAAREHKVHSGDVQVAGWIGERSELCRAQRVVVKVGTSTLTHPDGRFNFDRIEPLVTQLVQLANERREVLLVTSGAIGAGLNRLGLKKRPKTIPEKQAVAAVGQGLLMHMYERLFEERGRTVAQVLLTRDDLTHRKRHLNSRNTLHNLWRLGVIPIVNENDTVAVDEIKFGDNDTLAALVASLVGADLLIVLSDVDGFYDRNPRIHPDAELLSVVRAVTPEMQRSAGGPGTERGSGGMSTKLQAAKIATAAGIATVLANGARPNVLHDVLAGKEVGTFFVPQRTRMAGRKRWIAFHQHPSGTVRVDEGAGRALKSGGNSLLPIGIVGIEGVFDEGDVVRIVDSEGREVARGLVNYSSRDVAKIIGCSTQEIERRLGYKYYDEVVHRDNLVLMG